MDPCWDEGQNGNVQRASVNPPAPSREEESIKRELPLEKMFDTSVWQVSREAELRGAKTSLKLACSRRGALLIVSIMKSTHIH